MGFNNLIRKALKKSSWYYRFLRYYRTRTNIVPDWSFLEASAEWQAAKERAEGGKKIIIATGTGSNWPVSSFEGMLGIALTLRGADVSYLLCDGVLPACQECDHQWIKEKTLNEKGPGAALCSTCFKPASKMLFPTGLPVLKYSDFLDDFSESAKYDDSLEEHALAGALRFFARGTLPEEGGGRMMQRYRKASSMTAHVMQKLIEREKPYAAVFHHGIYVPQGAAGHVFRKNNVKVVNWGPAYRKSTVLFSHGDTYHHTMIDENPEKWADLNWDEQHIRRIKEYLESRWVGGNDWITFQNTDKKDDDATAKQLGLDMSRPVVCLLTNVIWDAQLHFTRSAFSNMLEWIFCTIDFFMKHKEMQLVIRVHPAEVKGTVPSRQMVADEVAARYGTLPENIRLIKPDEEISTYGLMSLSDCALVYGTKTALEFACFGVPVVVSGEAWARGKGFTIDVESRQEYIDILETLPLNRKLSESEIQEALRYAYHFFFRRMIPVSCLKPVKRFAPFRIHAESLDELKQGFDRGLDVVCSGILDGKDFIYRDENG